VEVVLDHWALLGSRSKRKLKPALQADLLETPGITGALHPLQQGGLEMIECQVGNCENAAHIVEEGKWYCDEHIVPVLRSKRSMQRARREQYLAAEVRVLTDKLTFAKSALLAHIERGHLYEED
jgi:hypothetical protein